MGCADSVPDGEPLPLEDPEGDTLGVLDPLAEPEADDEPDPDLEALDVWEREAASARARPAQRPSCCCSDRD